MAVLKKSTAQKKKRGVLQKVAIAFVAFIAIGVFVSCFGNGGISSTGSSSSAAELSSSSGQAISVGEIRLSPTTEFLEYSAKEVDPLTLISGANDEVTITTDDKIDLTSVGVQTVNYKLGYGEDMASQQLQFTVRDTKAPSIQFSNPKPSIDQGGDYDPQSCISRVSDPVDGDLQRVDAEPSAQGAVVGQEQFYDAGWYLVDGGVNSEVPGTYVLLVKASDRHGNVTTRELPVTVNEVVPEAAESAPAEAVHTYIANVNSKKFHLPECRDVSKMKDSNKEVFTTTRQEMINMGYSPCGHCHP